MSSLNASTRIFERFTRRHLLREQPGLAISSSRAVRRSFSPGSWQVGARHSDAHLITDATTDFGKKKINFTLGYGRVSGDVKVDDSDPTLRPPDGAHLTSRVRRLLS